MSLSWCINHVVIAVVPARGNSNLWIFVQRRRGLPKFEMGMGDTSHTLEACDLSEQPYQQEQDANMSLPYYC